jgi:uncharacterized RDD family membrane protein YckC
MKCPKCEYLGYETGNRCRHCGYDFSLIAEAPLATAASVHDRDFDLHLRDDPAPQPPPSFRGEPALPLFGHGADDEPLIKVPAAPRPPLSVRRTPDAPRHRPMAKTPREIEPTLAFQDAPDAVAETPAAAAVAPRTLAATATVTPTSVAPPTVTTAAAATTLSRRAWAAALDHAILLVIDVIVVDFTLRLASLTWADWRMLPAVPLILFLVLIKLAYFSMFTTVGGQTIGKMAAGIRVVGDKAALIDPARAVQRTIVGPLSLAALGTGFIPLLFGADRRPLHDRVAHTHVVNGPVV